jgi:hypothetical protein
MFALHVLIPLTSNEGATFTPAHHAAFEAFVVARFGGATRLSGTNTGTWVDAGVTYHDSSFTYEIAVSSITDGAKVAEVVAFAKAHYAQLAIFVRYLGVVEIL